MLFRSSTVSLGGSVKFTAALTGSMSPADTILTVQPNSAIYSVAAVDSNSAPVELNSRTYVDEYGILHVQKSGLSAGDVITVTATSAYINPSGATTTYTASDSVTVA